MKINFFLLVFSSASNVEKIELKSQKYVIGRELDCDIQIESTARFVSRYHCTLLLEWEEENFYYTIWDGRPQRNISKGGTYVNGKAIEDFAPLESGDLITFSQSALYPHLQFSVERQELDTEKEYQYA